MAEIHWSDLVRPRVPQDLSGAPQRRSPGSLLTSIKALTKGLSVGLMFLALLSACTQITPVAKKKKKVIPKVGAVSPSGGSTNGGTTLTIDGTGFLEGSTVTIGTLNCLNVTLLSPSRIRCVTPSGMPEGSQDVVITNPSGLAYRLPAAFTAFDTLPPVAGRVVAAQGGILTGEDGNGNVTLRMHMTVGEPVASSVQNGQLQNQPGTVLKARLGIQGVLFDQ